MTCHLHNISDKYDIDPTLIAEYSVYQALACEVYYVSLALLFFEYVIYSDYA